MDFFEILESAARLIGRLVRGAVGEIADEGVERTVEGVAERDEHRHTRRRGLGGLLSLSGAVLGVVALGILNAPETMRFAVEVGRGLRAQISGPAENASPSPTPPANPIMAVPSPARWVTDNVAFLSPKVREAIDVRLKRYADRTHHQVLVWIGSSTLGEPVESFATRTYNAWSVGRKGIDDGLVIFLFAADHTVRIEVGRGFETLLPSALAAKLIQEVIVPRLQAGDHDGALSKGVEATLRCLEGASWSEVANELGMSTPLKP